MLRTTKTTLTANVLALAAALSASSASSVALAEAPDALPPGPPTKDPERTGVTAGLGFGIAEMHIFQGGADTRSEGPGLSVRVGYGFTQNFMGLLLVDLVKANGLTNAMLGAGFNIYVTKRIFLRLGSGLGRLTSDGSSGSTGTTMMTSASTPTKLGVAGHGGLGVEFFQLQHLALDADFVTTVNKIVGDTSTAMNLSLMVGAQWF